MQNENILLFYWQQFDLFQFLYINILNNRYFHIDSDSSTFLKIKTLEKNTKR